MLNICQIHSSYSSNSYSGENIYVDKLQELLSKYFQCHTLTLSTDSLLRNVKERYIHGLKYLYTENSFFLRNTKNMDLIILHNSIPFISRQTLSALLKNTKVLKVWHNARPNCIAGGFYRQSSSCTACLDSKFGKFSSVINRCYRNSRLQSAVIQTVEQKMASLFEHPNMYHLAISEYIKDQIMTFGVSEKKIFSIPNFSQKLSVIPEHGKDYLFVGRLDSAKGSAELIKAWSLLTQKERGERKLHLVGSAIGQKWSENVQELVSNCENGIEVHGELSHAEINLLAFKCRTYVVPSQWEEAFGNVSIEGLSMGLRLIVTPSGALSSLRGFSGVTVAENKSSLAILAAIRKDLSSPVLSPLNISNDWHLNFSSEVIGKKWNSAIHQIVSN